MECDYSKWFYLCLALVAGIVIITLVSYSYNLKLDRKSVKLEANDKQQEHKHSQNEERIKKLEEKNGHELQEIEELKIEIKTLKGVIERMSKTKNEVTNK